MAQLINTANALGTYQTMEVTAETELAVELSALSIAKTADKRIWVGDDLTYSIVVTNIDQEVPGESVTDLTITDYIDPAIASFIDGSLVVTLGTDPTPIVDPTYNYDPITGILTVMLDELAPRQYATLSFRVAKVP